MATVGTATIKIKPVLDEEALALIAEAIEDAVTRAVDNALAARPITLQVAPPNSAGPFYDTTLGIRMQGGAQ